MAVPTPQWDRFYRHTEFSALLQGYAAAFPELVSIESIGKSFEGRDIWVLTLTNRKTGAAADKPAYWVDANIHASELAGGTASLYLLDLLTKQYGKREDITRCLDTRTLYLCPRINPDGAEWAMLPPEEGGPKIIRSSTRPYPYDEEPIDGLDIQDIDGDGRILSMRIPDPNGNWKCHPTEPRLMIAREPDEFGGQYYRIMPEGNLRDYDGYTVKVNRDKQGLDLNRNFPGNWRQEFEQLGAGPYPTSEPEVRAVVHFITHHSNICAALSFHTWSGVLLRPMSTQPDAELPAEDLWEYQRQGKKGEAITGYPAISTYEEFRYHPKEVISGTFDWIYDHLGLYEWTVEIWCPMREAGITNYKYIDWFRSHAVEDDLKMLAWADRELKGKGYVDWYAFDHPQLGKVEIGGWDKIYAFRNPPPHLLECEVAKFPDWILHNALITPQLDIIETKLEKLSADTHKLTLVVQNAGYLPTYVSKRAKARGQSRGVIVDLTCGTGVELANGKTRTTLGELEGRAYKHTLMSFWSDTTPTADRAVLECVLKGKGDVQIEARHDKAGRVSKKVTIA